MRKILFSLALLISNFGFSQRSNWIHENFQNNNNKWDMLSSSVVSSKINTKKLYIKTSAESWYFVPRAIKPINKISILNIECNFEVL